jgi:replicative DNA helicase
MKDSPHHLEAEYAIIGSFFHYSDEAIKYIEFLKPEHFFIKRHQAIIQAILDLALEDKPVDLVNAIDKLKSSKNYDAFETREQIENCLKYATHPENIKTHIKIVTKYWNLRKVKKACDLISLKSKEVKEDEIDDLLAEAQTTFIEIYESNKIKGPKTIDILVKNTFSKLDKISSGEETNLNILTGFKDFDKITSGFKPSHLIVLAARPGMGKTSLVLNIAMNSAFNQNKQVVIFSLEMSEDDITQRMLSIHCQVPSTHFGDALFTKEELEKLYFEARIFETKKIIVDETEKISILDLANQCRKIKRDTGSCDLIIIDYLQLMTVSNLNTKEGREREISIISGSLKALAKELNCTVLACAQLNRNVETRADKRPKTSDLRESGSIEQDADLVFFIYRDEVHNKDSLDKGTAELIIGKNRYGAMDTVRLTFKPQYTSFHNYTNT